MKNIKESPFPDPSAALDIDVFRSLLQDVLRKDHPSLRVLGGRICDVKYEPDRQYILLYRFKIENLLTGRTRKHYFTVTVLRKGAALPELSEKEIDRYRQVKDLWIHIPEFILPEHPIIIHPFPNDMGLPWLIDLLDPCSMKDSLNRMWTYHGCRARKVKVTLLGYTPHMRASLLLDVLVEENVSKRRCWQQMIGKTNAFKMPARLYSGIWALWQAGKGSIGLPRPRGFVMNPPLTLQERVRGERLGSLVDSPSIHDILGETARAIARFHQLSIPLGTKRKLKDEVRSIERWSGVLSEIDPTMKKSIASFRRHLLSEMERRMNIKSPVHADFHHTNVLVDGEKINIIDLDEMAYGDPCLDVGRFLASLRIPSLRTFGTITRLNGERETFIEEYLKIRSEHVDNIRLFEAASLLVSAASAFRIQRPEWKKEVSLLFEEADRVFTMSQQRRVNTSPETQGSGFPQIPAKDRLQWALDETYMHTIMSPHIKEYYDAEITTCRVKKKERMPSAYRVMYRLEGWKKDKKWKAEAEGFIAKGDRGNHGISRLSLLHDAMKRTPDGFLFPKPIAYLPQIDTLVMEKVSGTPLSSIIGTPDTKRAVDGFAKALYTLHCVDIERKKVHSAANEFCALLNRVLALKDDAPLFYSEALSLFPEIEAQSSFISDSIAPVLFTIHPEHILYSGNRISVSGMTSIRHAHPYLDVGNFVAQLMLAGIRDDRMKEIEKIADHFRSSYLSLADCRSNGLSAFEAGALIRTACLQLHKHRDDTMPFLLLDYARRRLEAHAA